MNIIYKGDSFSFSNEKEGNMYTEVSFRGEHLGYASFFDHWTWEHSALIPVSRDLSWCDIDTSGEDGPSLFKNGIISWDNDSEKFVYVENEEPAMGGRYIGAGEGSGSYIEDCFSLGNDLVVFQCCGD